LLNIAPIMAFNLFRYLQCRKDDHRWQVSLDNRREKVCSHCGLRRPRRTREQRRVKRAAE